MPTAQQYISPQQLMPSELVSKDYALLDASIKERAFFMAAVTDAKVLDKNKALASAIVRGEISQGQAMESLRRFYEETGYRARPAEAGTIKDLSTPRRMRATIETNVAMARGWARKQQLTGNIDQPGIELYRSRQAAAPRDWDARWMAAGAQVNWQGASREAMIALADSPIWVALSEFGQPYPPFDWGSKMGLRPVSLDRCIQLGLIADPATPEGKQQLREIRDTGYKSMNDDYHVPDTLTDKQVRSDLAEKLTGLAEMENGVIRMTDVNGTRPYDWREIGRVITTPNQAGIPLRQAKAVTEFIHNSDAYTPLTEQEKTEGRQNVKRVSLDMIADMNNYIERIKPVSSESPDGGTITRGIRVPASQHADFLDRVMTGGYRARPGYIAESWSSSSVVADKYSGEDGVVLISSSYHSRKRIDGTYKHLDMKYKNSSKPEIIEGESLFSGHVEWAYKSHYRKNGKLYIELEEKR